MTKVQINLHVNNLDDKPYKQIQYLQKTYPIKTYLKTKH